MPLPRPSRSGQVYFLREREKWTDNPRRDIRDHGALPLERVTATTLKPEGLTRYRPGEGVLSQHQEAPHARNRPLILKQWHGGVAEMEDPVDDGGTALRASN